VSMPVTGDGSVVPGLIDHLSPSALGVYDTCPRKYWYRYVMGIRTPPDGGLAMGRAVHEGAALGMYFKQQRQENPPAEMVKEKALEVARDELREAVLDEDETPEGVISTSVRLTGAWADGPAKTAQPEQIEATWKATVAGINVVGKVDVLETTGEVIDWKTGKRTPRAEDVLKNPQSELYTAVVARPIRYSYLIDLKTAPKTLEIRIEGEDLGLMRRLAFDHVQDVAEAIRKGIFPRNRNGWWCSKRWCPHFERCMSGRDHP
jgi:CRISPR/Cas system-associated exonuclease Cas4 (RecB family)